MRGAALTIRYALAIISGALAAAAPLATQVADDRTSDSSVFFESIDVRVINVEIVVTDGRGQRVEGLEPGDFRITIDGDEAPIDFFTEIAGGRVRPARPVGEAAATVPPPLAAAEAGEQVPTRLVVFVDNLFAVAHRRNEVLDAIEDSLSELSPEDWMAVVAFDGQDLQILCGWENRREVIAQALETARSAPAFGFHRLAELRQIDASRDLEREAFAMLEVRMSTGNASPFGDGDEEDPSRGEADSERAFANLRNMTLHRAGGVEVDFAFLAQRQLRSTALAAATAMRELSSGDGRKAMLLLAGGWPSSALEYAISDGTQSAAMMIDVSLTRAQLDADDPLVPMTDTANLLGFTLYPIDVPGFQRADTMAIGAANDSAVSIDQKEPTDLGVPQRERELFLHDSLDFVAHETGGEPLINAQRLHALPAVYADTRDYYWMGFSRGREDSDRHHAIEVEVLRPGLEARARAGFLDLSEISEADLLVEAALLFDSFTAASPLELDLGEPLQPLKKKLEVPLDVRIPLSALTMVPTGGAYVGEIEVRISVMDEQGNQASGEVRGLSIQGDGPPHPDAYYTYSTMLEIRNRDHKIVVGVQDILGGASLAGTTKLGPDRRR